MRIVRLWAACAWADKKMHPAELAALKRCIEAQDLSGAEAAEAQSLLERPGELDLAEVRKLDASSREGVYRAAVGIARLDREVSEEEIRFLSNLRENLDLDPATIERIDAEA